MRPRAVMADDFRGGERAEIAAHFERLAPGQTEQNARCGKISRTCGATTCQRVQRGCQGFAVSQNHRAFSERVTQATGDFTAAARRRGCSSRRAIRSGLHWRTGCRLVFDQMPEKVAVTIDTEQIRQSQRHLPACRFGIFGGLHERGLGFVAIEQIAFHESDCRRFNRPLSRSETPNIDEAPKKVLIDRAPPSVTTMTQRAVARPPPAARCGLRLRSLRYRCGRRCPEHRFLLSRYRRPCHQGCDAGDGVGAGAAGKLLRAGERLGEGVCARFVDQGHGVFFNGVRRQKSIRLGCDGIHDRIADAAYVELSRRHECLQDCRVSCRLAAFGASGKAAIAPEPKSEDAVPMSKKSLVIAVGLLALAGCASSGSSYPSLPGAPMSAYSGPLSGASPAQVQSQLGEPNLVRDEGQGALWTYRFSNCALLVGFSGSASARRVSAVEAVPSDGTISALARSLHRGGAALSFSCRPFRRDRFAGLFNLGGFHFRRRRLWLKRAKIHNHAGIATRLDRNASVTAV